MNILVLALVPCMVIASPVPGADEGVINETSSVTERYQTPASRLNVTTHGDSGKSSRHFLFPQPSYGVRPWSLDLLRQTIDRFEQYIESVARSWLGASSWNKDSSLSPEEQQPLPTYLLFPPILSSQFDLAENYSNSTHTITYEDGNRVIVNETRRKVSLPNLSSVFHSKFVHILPDYDESTTADPGEYERSEVESEETSLENYLAQFDATDNEVGSLLRKIKTVSTSIPTQNHLPSLNQKDLFASEQKPYHPVHPIAYVAEPLPHWSKTRFLSNSLQGEMPFSSGVSILNKPSTYNSVVTSENLRQSGGYSMVQSPLADNPHDLFRPLPDLSRDTRVNQLAAQVITFLEPDSETFDPKGVAKE